MPRRARSGIGNLEKRGSSFRARLSVGGKRHYFTIRTTDRELAHHAAEKRYRELCKAEELRAVGLPGELRFSALLAEFEALELPTLASGTRRSYNDSFKPFRAYFVETQGDPPIARIRSAEIKAYLAWRRVNRHNGSGAVSPHTVARDRRVLHRLFNHAVAMEYLEANPVARVRAPKGDPRSPKILDGAEFDRLLKACEHDPMLHLYVLFLGETGTRAFSEALHLHWEDVDLSGGFVQIVSGRGSHRTKSGRSRWVPLTPRLHAALRAHFARFRLATYDGVRSPWVFHHLAPRRTCRPGDRLASLRAGFVKAVRNADLPAELRQHDLRHRRVTTWLAEGASPVLVQEAMGHSAIQTTLGYTHLSREHLRALVKVHEGEL